MNLMRFFIKLVLPTPLYFWQYIAAAVIGGLLGGALNKPKATKTQKQPVPTATKEKKRLTGTAGAGSVSLGSISRGKPKKSMK